ncbi:hypothetical protein LINGRAHAP2_LOCUS12781, partial [Linum grandiflorum]
KSRASQSSSLLLYPSSSFLFSLQNPDEQFQTPLLQPNKTLKPELKVLPQQLFLISYRVSSPPAKRMSFKEGKKRSITPSSADLLVCFPSRQHLTLMPSKPICSPARGDHQPRSRHRRHSSSAGMAAARMKTKQMMRNSADVSEPTSPKVTCSGQIKVRHKKGGGGKGSWQSVMEEIERIHKQGKLKQRMKKSSTWTHSIGFLACLRNVKLDFRCFGVFPQPEMTNSDDDEAEEDEEEEEDGIDDDDDQEGRTVFSKWFMVLQEEKEELDNNCTSSNCDPVIPPANALLLMRCRSAPPTKSLKTLMEEEKKTDSNRLVMTSYGDDDADFYKISSDIAKETWVVGGIGDALSRSRSWKR